MSVSGLEWKPEKNVAHTFTKSAPRKDKRGFDLISDVLPFGRLWYDGPQAVANAIGYVQFYSRSHKRIISSLIMFRRFAPVALAITIISGDAGATSVNENDSKPRSMSEGEAYALAIYAPRPAYPYAARDKHLTGSGIVLVNVDSSTGTVISAQVLKSTGYKVLDASALEAFRQWHLRFPFNSRRRASSTK